MIYQAPDEFIDLLKNLNKKVFAEQVIGWLEWASNNPAKAIKVAKKYWRLGKNGQQTFQEYLRFAHPPDYVMNLTLIHEKKLRSKRKKLSRIIHAAKKKGYKFTLKNGVPCILKKNDNNYWFEFNVAGETIFLLYAGFYLFHIIEQMKKDKIPSFSLQTVIYKEHACKPATKEAEILIKAIERNIKPEVLVAIDPDLAK
ncbi:MAG: hypothetical protein QW445_07505 [Candidatus Bathyarchaeia archaeon]